MDQLAQQFGYADYNTFVTDIFRKPSKTTEQLYREAYDAAGLGELRGKMTEKKNQLASAELNINDNPWLSEAARLRPAKRSFPR